MPNTKTAFRWSSDKIAFGVLALLSLEPALSAILGRLAKGGWWFGDFDALLCGATRIAAGHSPYSLTPVCSGLVPARFVYAPQIGYAVAPVVQALGPDGARLAGMALFIPFTLLILWYAVLKPTPRVPMTMKLFALMAVRGSPLASGNVGAILHGLIIAAILRLKTYRWLFIIVVIGCALVKPFFLAALIVLLFEERPPENASDGLCSGACFWCRGSDSAYFDRWRVWRAMAGSAPHHRLSGAAWPGLFGLRMVFGSASGHAPCYSGLRSLRKPYGRCGPRPRGDGEAL
ncbi:hypothetical protein [Asticcacaulis sp. AC466]|uniref:hypothetical protein n=1 Tax=Asticcacaulis sp. AC466 TaxID=1282362 RepID=UPI0012DD4A74|nr:hypothetical protein [Asticcacaulis sp. AC466]